MDTGFAYKENFSDCRKDHLLIISLNMYTITAPRSLQKRKYHKKSGNNTGSIDFAFCIDEL